MSTFVGKYVCYGTKEGMFCWGKIKSEVEVNTVEGPRKAFILEGRMSGPYSVMERIKKHRGDTILRQDQINLTRDIVDRDTSGLESLSDEDLFLMTLQSTEIETRDLSHRGMSNMLKAQAGEELSDFAAAELKRRMGMTQD